MGVADAAFAGAVTFAPRRPGGHVEFLPHGGEVVLGDSDEVNSLAAGNLDEGNVIFAATLAMRINSSGVQTPPAILGTTEKRPSFCTLPWT